MQKTNDISDEVLAEVTRTRDKERYAELVTRYQTKLLRYARYLLNDDQKALDIVQESFIKAYINLNGFDTGQKFSSWIYRIVHNEAMNTIKKFRKESPLVKDFDYTGDMDVEEEYSKREIIDMTQKCLQSMPVRYSEPLVLYYLDDKSYDEISDILRMPMGTVATRINRAKALMKKICQRNK